MINLAGFFFFLTFILPSFLTFCRSSFTSRLSQTRIADWREGALNGAYLCRRLQEAAEHIKFYELNATPKGWSCHWDRYALLTFHISKLPRSSQKVLWCDYGPPESQGCRLCNMT